MNFNSIFWKIKQNLGEQKSAKRMNFLVASTSVELFLLGKWSQLNTFDVTKVDTKIDSKKIFTCWNLYIKIAKWFKKRLRMKTIWQENKVNLLFKNIKFEIQKFSKRRVDICSISDRYRQGPELFWVFAGNKKKLFCRENIK